MPKAYTGIDIGNNSVKLAVCKDGVASKLVSEVLPEGMMAEGRLVSFDSMADFLKKVVRANGGIAKDAAVILSPRESLTRRLSMPVMSDKELALNLPYEFRDYISQGKDKYFFDYAVLGVEPGNLGEPDSLELLACATLKETIEDYDAMLRRAGLRLRIALTAPAAFQNAMMLAQCQQTCCFIDFAHRTTTLHFFSQGKYDVTRIIELGGVDVDRAIGLSYSVDDRVAAGYKESNFRAAQICPEAMAVYENIATEIGRAVNFYNFNNPDQNLEAVYCCGTGSVLHPMLNEVSGVVGCEVLPASILARSAGDTQAACVCFAAIGATVEA